MGDILKSISQPSRWLSVVVAGLLINLLAAYLKPWLDKYIARYSTSRRELLEGRRVERAALTLKMAKDRSLVLEAKVDMINSALQGIALLLIDILAVNLLREVELSRGLQIAKLVILLLLSAASLYFLILAGRSESLINEADHLRKQQTADDLEREES